MNCRSSKAYRWAATSRVTGYAIEPLEVRRSLCASQVHTGSASDDRACRPSRCSGPSARRAPRRDRLTAMNISVVSVKATVLTVAVGLCLVAGGCRDRDQNPQHVPSTIPATVTPQTAVPSSTEGQLPTNAIPPTNGVAPTTQPSSAQNSPPIITRIIPPTATPLPHTQTEPSGFGPPEPTSPAPKDKSVEPGTP